MLARKLELVHSATKMMVAGEVYDDKASVDLSEEDLSKGLKRMLPLLFR